TRGPCSVTDKVVPEIPGWSVPSMATVSVLGSEKMNVYLFALPASTFIVSAGNWDREESSFHLPANGSSAAREISMTRQTAISSCIVPFNICFSLQGGDFDPPGSS